MRACLDPASIALCALEMEVEDATFPDQVRHGSLPHLPFAAVFLEPFVACLDLNTLLLYILAYT